MAVLFCTHQQQVGVIKQSSVGLLKDIHVRFFFFIFFLVLGATEPAKRRMRSSRMKTRMCCLFWPGVLFIFFLSILACVRVGTATHTDASLRYRAVSDGARTVDAK